jgi:TolA-binding protein
MGLRVSFCFGLLAVLSLARAQPPLNVPPPLAAPGAPARSAAQEVLAMTAAERAVAMGFPSAAEAIYRELLQHPGADRAGITLGLATALLDQGRGADAEKVLDAFDGPRGAAWHLRRGLAAVQQGFVTTAKGERDASRIDELPPADRGWHLFLQGLIATAENEHGKAVVLFGQAMDAAVSGPARARFLLKREQARLRGGSPVTDAQIEATRRSMEQFQGRRAGYDLARTLAAMLDAAGKKSEAIEVLRRELASLPAEERDELDEMRLLLGLIAGADEGAGRSALERLLERGNDRDKQRVALQMLARASTRNPQLGNFRKELDQLIAATPPHPILEDLLLFRAQAALATKTSEGYARAEEDARTLLQKFPGSPLKAHAYGVLTESAWEQLRYRTAADNAAKARELLPPGPEHAAFSVLVAEAWFRARDFRSAAEAYAAALTERPPGVAPGELLFQRVLAEIEAGTPEAAATMLDELARDPAFDAENRWQAEWNLARALLAKGRTAEAFARVNRLLAGEGAAALPPELRARMVWMQARLSAASGQPEQTLKFIEGFPAVLRGVSAGLRDEIASSGALLKAEANFALGNDGAALEILQKLRADFPKSDAAVYSYFDEAEFNARQDKAAEAQQNLTKVADEFPDHPYAPFALYQAALQAERRGQDANLVEANKLIEDMLALVQKFPHPESEELVFAARMKQGNFFRKRNDFASAQRAYEELVNKYQYSQGSDAALAQLALAQLALAETHNAQSASQPAHTESAMVLFEHVRDWVKAPIDARVEAGFNLGFLHARRNEPGKAETVWWRDVVDAFLLNPEQAAKLGAQGRFWMARTLFELGSLYEQQEKLEQAKEAWLLILKSNLGTGEALAKARLARYDLPEAKP